MESATETPPELPPQVPPEAPREPILTLPSALTAYVVLIAVIHLRV
ncbi:MAG: rhomboid family intramembrane serine protease, partial [Alphaproteobacteria bacterium]